MFKESGTMVGGYIIKIRKWIHFIVIMVLLN
jgi:hypothetical protein